MTYIPPNPTITITPDQNTPGQPVRPIGQEVLAAGFGLVGASVLDPMFNAPIVGTGVTYAQAAGALNIGSGTTVNAEFLARSSRAVNGANRMRFSIITSARIVNSNLAVMLADLLGEGLAFTINSATSVTVTLAAHGFTSQNVGQFVFLGGIVGAAGVPGRYAIASIPNANSINFTVAGWPASGAGTLTLFGRSYIRNLFTGTVATTVNVDAQRGGWATGDTVANINTTASPGTMISQEMTGRDIFWNDTLRASAAVPASTTRASRYENIPDSNTSLYVFLWSYNGTVAPAGSVTYSLGSLAVEDFTNTPVYIQGNRAMGSQNAMPVFSTGGGVNINSGTLNVQSGGVAAPLQVADVASTALTTTATTSSVTPSAGCSYSVDIPVTVVSGTNPTLDVQIQESDDSSTNWYSVYDFPRITAVGIYRSPVLPLTGNRVRYVQTVGGTTPSFTRSINRLQSSLSTYGPTRQLIDRTINLTTLNSVTAVLTTQGCNQFQIIGNIGAATTPPSVQLQGSDDNGGSWYNIGTPVALVANQTTQATVNNMNCQMIRGIVTTAGTGVTAGYVLIKGFYV